jgi:hypothetical protein
MTLPDYLTIPVTHESGLASRLLGETGMTLRREQRPAAPLTDWLYDENIPDKARAVLESEARFAGIAGLIRVAFEPTGGEGFAAIWVLARAPEALVSVMVRDAGSATGIQLQNDVGFSMQQARRYCARAAILLVQSRTTSESMAGFSQFSVVYEQPHPVCDRMYRAQEIDGISLNYAWLSADRVKH